MKRALFLLPLTLLFACGHERNYNLEKLVRWRDSIRYADSVSGVNGSGYTDANGLRQGYWIMRNSTLHLPGYRDRDEIREGSYKDGKKQGIWTEFWPGGAIKARLTYKDDSLIKRDTTNLEMFQKPYTDEKGRKEGYWIIYNSTARIAGYQDNDKVEEGFYKDDKKEGLWIKYYPGGTIKEKLTYVHDSVVSRDSLSFKANTDDKAVKKR